MSVFEGLDRSGSLVKGDLLKTWTAEVDAAMQRVRRDATCPNCGGLMVYGEPCTTSAPPEKP